MSYSSGLSTADKTSSSLYVHRSNNNTGYNYY